LIGSVSCRFSGASSERRRLPSIRVAAGGFIRAAPINRVVALLTLAALLAGCGNALRWRDYDYVVQPGDTLYSIAWHFNLDYRDLAHWNRIASPYTIYPGEKLVLNGAHGAYSARTPSRVASSSHKRSSSGAARASPRRSSSTPAHKRKTPHRKSSPSPVSKWQWPASGDVISRFDPDKLNAKGINIHGRLGEAVRAAAGGRVVYSGNGLQGYGELIIIKHNDHYLSAYAHNRRRLVKQGDVVSAGDEIATMGHGNDGKALLHFEIRRDGKPVDPLHYLPSRQ
jgi:lipoprotein NlpD